MELLSLELPECSFTPAAKAVECTTIRIDKGHLVGRKINNLEDGRHITARINLKRPKDSTGTGIQVSHLPCVVSDVLNAESTIVQQLAAGIKLLQ